MPLSLAQTIRLLQKFYGRPKPPKIVDPLEQILWENVAYLVGDEKRAAAFAVLKKNVGTTAARILKAPEAKLVEATRLGGMLPEKRAQRLRQIAEIAHWIFHDDLAAVLKKP